MAFKSKVTAQGQISVPAEIRRLLGIGPGSVLEWEQDDGRVVVTRSGRFSSREIHDAIFPDGAPDRKSLDELKAGLRRHIVKRHASR